MRFVIYLASLLTLAGLICLGEQRSQEARAQVVSCTGSVGVNNVQTSTNCASGPCSQYTALLARTTGWDATHQSASQALVCNGVNHGWWAKTDALWVLRTNSAANAILNWISTSFTLSVQGSVTFVADAGVTSDGTTGFYKTGYTLGSSGNLTQNSGTLAACNTAAALHTENAIGGLNGAATIADEIALVTGSVLTFGFMSNVAGTSVGNVNPHLWMISRTAPNLATLYQDGSSVGTDTTASVGNPGVEAYVLARNNNGTADNFTFVQYAVAMIGIGFTPQNASDFRTDFQTYAATIGTGGPC